MPYKLLTAIVNVVNRTATIQESARALTQRVALRQVALQETVTTLAQKETMKYLDTAGLVRQIYALDAAKLLTLLPPEISIPRIGRGLITPLEEEEYVTKRMLPLYREDEHITKIRERVEPLLVRELVRLRRLHPTAISLIDQRLTALNEMYLWINLRTETQQVLEQIMRMSELKRWFIEPVIGLEHLEKWLIQFYVPAFDTAERAVNMLGLRVTPLTMQYLEGKAGSLYIIYSIQAIATKIKSWIISALYRKPETKAVAISKGRKEFIPSKRTIAVSESISKETEVNLGKDLFNKEFLFTALRYAYGMPFWVRRLLAREFGMPESHKYARYFGIGCIPSRRARWSWKREQMPEEVKYLYYSKDEYVMKMIRKYRSRYGEATSNRRLFRKFGF